MDLLKKIDNRFQERLQSSNVFVLMLQGLSAACFGSFVFILAVLLILTLFGVFSWPVFGLLALLAFVANLFTVRHITGKMLKKIEDRYGKVGDVMDAVNEQLLADAYWLEGQGRYFGTYITKDWFMSTWCFRPWFVKLSDVVYIGRRDTAGLKQMRVLLDDGELIKAPVALTNSQYRHLLDLAAQGNPRLLTSGAAALPDGQAVELHAAPPSALLEEYRRRKS